MKFRGTRSTKPAKGDIASRIRNPQNPTKAYRNIGPILDTSGTRPGIDQPDGVGSICVSRAKESAKAISSAAAMAFSHR